MNDAPQTSYGDLMAARALALRAGGAKYVQIAAALNLGSTSHAYYYLNLERLRAAARNRKRKAAR